MHENGGQFIGVDAHVLGDVAIGLLDFGLGNVDAEVLGLVDFEHLVDQRVEHLLARRQLLRAQLFELLALRDVELRDRYAVDQRGDFLGAGVSNRPASVIAAASAAPARRARSL